MIANTSSFLVEALVYDVDVVDRNRLIYETVTSLLIMGKTCTSIIQIG